MKIGANLIILISAFFYSSCTYDKSEVDGQTFGGKVIDYTTHNPVPGATVTLMRAGNFYSGDSIREGVIILDSIGVPVDSVYTFSYQLDPSIEYFYTTSDASGNYKFIVPWDEAKTLYKISSSKDGYVNADNSVIGRVMTSGTNYTDFTYLDKASTLRINFHDTRASSLNDTLVFNVRFSYEDHIGPGGLIIVGRSFSRNHTAVISNNSVVQFSDNVFLKKYDLTSISYSVRNNGIIEELPDSSITLIEFGTKVIDIFY